MVGDFYKGQDWLLVGTMTFRVSDVYNIDR